MLLPGDKHVGILNVKEKLLRGWSRRMAQKREGIHVSDLTMYRRKVCFEKLDTSLPTEVDERRIKYYWSGEYKHRALQELLGEDEFECEKEVVWKGGPVPIIGHPDAIYKKDGAVIEWKTTESVKATHEVYPHHVKQLKYYLAILGAPYGVVSYMIMGYPNVKEYFPEYLVTFQYANERKAILHRLEREAAELQYGISGRDPSLIEHIAKDPIYINKWSHNWLCSNCPYKKQCTQIRADTGEFAVQTVKALESKRLAPAADSESDTINYMRFG